MNKTRETEPGRDGDETPEQTQSLFQRWRESRRPGARIPKVLWAAAVRMAKRYGVPQTAQHLRVDSQQLLKRIEGAGGAAPTGPRPIAFVALPGLAPSAEAGIAECTVELQNARGQTMRVRLQGLGLTHLAPLCAAFWEAP